MSSAQEPTVREMYTKVEDPLPHMRYSLHQVSCIVVDPYSGKKKYITFQGTGTLLIEPVMRNTHQEDNKAKTFDGNQATIVVSVMAMREDAIDG